MDYKVNLQKHIFLLLPIHTHIFLHDSESLMSLRILAVPLFETVSACFISSKAFHGTRVLIELEQ